MAEVKKINSMGDFNMFIMEGNSLNVLKLGASWCGPCRIIENTLHNLTTEETEGVLLGEVDVDDEWFEDVEGMLNIRGIPVIIAYKDGKEVERIIGATTKDKLLEFFGRNK